MKRILLILLSLFLLLSLFGCGSTVYINSDIDLSASLSQEINSILEGVEPYKTKNIKGNVEITEIYLPSDDGFALNIPSDALLKDSSTPCETVIIFEENDILQNSSNKYAYLLLKYSSWGNGFFIEQCSRAELKDNTITLTCPKNHTTDDGYIYSTAILKIKRSTLTEKIEKISVEITEE